MCSVEALVVMGTKRDPFDQETNCSVYEYWQQVACLPGLKPSEIANREAIASKSAKFSDVSPNTPYMRTD